MAKTLTGTRPPGRILRPSLQGEGESKRLMYRGIPRYAPGPKAPPGIKRFQKRDPALVVLDKFKAKVKKAIKRAMDEAELGPAFRKHSEIPVGQKIDEHWNHQFLYVVGCDRCWQRENKRAIRLSHYFGYEDEIDGDWDDFHRDKMKDAAELRRQKPKCKYTKKLHRSHISFQHAREKKKNKKMMRDY